MKNPMKSNEKLHDFKEKLRGLDDTLHGLNEKPKGSNEKLHDFKEKLHGLDDELHGLNEKPKGSNEKLHDFKEELHDERGKAGGHEPPLFPLPCHILAFFLFRQP